MWSSLQRWLAPWLPFLRPKQAVSTMSGLSLWLCPSDSDKVALRSLIDDLARENPGCVAFDPHLTLVSDDQVPDIPPEQVLAKTSAGVDEWRHAHHGSLEVVFKHVRTGSHFYQCVLIAADLASPLMSLNATLRTALAVPSDAPSYHLVYGDLDERQRQGCVDGLEASGRVKQKDDTVEVAGVDRYSPAEILLVRTSGPSSDWQVLGSVGL